MGVALTAIAVWLARGFHEAGEGEPGVGVVRRITDREARSTGTERAF